MSKEAIDKAEGIAKQILQSPTGLVGLLLAVTVVSFVGKEWYFSAEGARIDAQNAQSRQDHADAARRQADALTQIAANEKKESAEILRVLQENATNFKKYMEQEQAERIAIQATLNLLRDLIKERGPCDERIVGESIVADPGRRGDDSDR